MTTSNTFGRWALAFAETEESVASEARTRVERRIGFDASPVEIVRAIYRDKLAALQGAHAYSESGSLYTSVLLHRATVKELFPVATPEDVEALMGVDLPTLQWLVNNKLVLLLIQHPRQYARLDFLHEIMMSSAGIACYEIRDREVFGYLSRGVYEDLIRRGHSHPVFGRATPFPAGLQEGYERRLVQRSARWSQRNAQRYAALSALMGSELLDQSLEVPLNTNLSREQVYSAQAKFFYLHRYLLHPVTQGLGGTPYSLPGISGQHYTARAAQFGSELETRLTSALSIPLPARADIRMIEAVQSTEVPKLFEGIEREIVGMASNEDGQEKDVRGQVDLIVEELDEQARRIDSVLSRVHAAVQVVGLGSSVALARDNPEVSGAVGGASAFVPKRAVRAVADAYARVFEKDNLPWQFWRLKNKVSKSFIKGEP